MTATAWRKLWQCVAGLLGAAGVALGAAAAHLAASGDAGHLQLASGFLIFHALALLGVAALTRGPAETGSGRWLKLAGVLFALGAICFSGGLTLNQLVTQALGPLIPVGGTALILGWLALAVSAVADRAPLT